jgi:hypothetical protein
MPKTVVLVHGRHCGMATEEWETLVFGSDKQIGTAPLGLHLALKYDARLIFGSGGSMRDGLNECEFTQKFLLDNVKRLVAFPEFAYMRTTPPHLSALHELAAMRVVVANAHLDKEGVDTITEVKNAVRHACSLGATELIQVTSPFHAARGMSISAKLLEDGFDFGDVVPMVVSAKSSTAKCRAATTVILEHPHRGDDPMIASPLAPHEIFPRMFKLFPPARMEFFMETNNRLKELGV